MRVGAWLWEQTVGAVCQLGYSSPLVSPFSKKKKQLFTSSVTIMLGLERNTVYVNEIR